MYWGKVNLEDGSIEGEWGRTPTKPRQGTFKLTKRKFSSDDEYPDSNYYSISSDGEDLDPDSTEIQD